MTPTWFQSPKLRQLLATSGAIALSFLAVVGLQRPRLAALLNQSESLTPAAYQRQVEQAKLNLELLQNIPALGFDNLLADWIFLQYLQYFGDDDARQVTGYGLVLDYLRPVIRNDPRFRDAHLYLATSGTLYAAQPAATDELMAWGLQFMQPQHPRHAYRVLNNRGVNQFLFLGNLPAALESIEQAADWAASYDEPGAQATADNIRRFADFLAQNPDSKVAQISAWMTILNSVPDEPTQERVIGEIEDLGGRVTRADSGQWQVTFPESDAD